MLAPDGRNFRATHRQYDGMKHFLPANGNSVICPSSEKQPNIQAGLIDLIAPLRGATR